MRRRRLPVVATGGYARLISSKLPEITAVEPLLTLEGLRLVWEAGDRRKFRSADFPSPVLLSRIHAVRI